MKAIAPSILSADFCKLGNNIQEIEEAGGTHLHIDVMDGMFVPEVSFGPPIIKSIRPISKLFFDVHLMVCNPYKQIEQYVKSGADHITIHVESCDNVGEILDLIHSFGIKAGISLKPNTKVDTIIPYLNQVDMILVMSVEPGYAGQTYLEESTNRIRHIRELLDEKNLQVAIEVDGGIKRDNIQEVLDAGADVLVVGSEIFSGSITENLEYFLSAVK